MKQDDLLNVLIDEWEAEWETDEGSMSREDDVNWGLKFVIRTIDKDNKRMMTQL